MNRLFKNPKAISATVGVVITGIVGIGHFIREKISDIIDKERQQLEYIVDETNKRNAFIVENIPSFAHELGKQNTGRKFSQDRDHQKSITETRSYIILKAQTVPMNVSEYIVDFLHHILHEQDIYVFEGSRAHCQISASGGVFDINVAGIQSGFDLSDQPRIVSGKANDEQFLLHLDGYEDPLPLHFFRVDVSEQQITRTIHLDFNGWDENKDEITLRVSVNVR